MSYTYQNLLDVITLHLDFEPRKLNKSEKQLISKIIGCPTRDLIDEYSIEQAIESPNYISFGDEEITQYVLDKQTNEIYYLELDNYPESTITPISQK